jgi:hypothetical protein
VTRRRRTTLPTQPIPPETIREVAAPGPGLASPQRAITASDLEHAAAIAAEPCAICGAKPGQECEYGKEQGGAARGVPQFQGRAHTRRVRVHLGKTEDT